MSKLITIIIPVYKDFLQANEIISLQQCYNVLSDYEIVFVCPEKLKNGKFHNDNINQGKFLFLENSNFNSIYDYNEMLLSTWFYNFFLNYKYILIYQLDCFVFKDELQKWIDKNYSYIGAPWFLYNSDDESVNEFYGVGNGGFSLRKVNDFIKVTKSNRKVWPVKNYINRKNNNFFFIAYLKGIIKFIFSDSFKTIRKNKLINEDKIFFEASKRFDYFKIPEPEEALSFAFEKQAEKLYKLNNYNLPFGCHAWWKFSFDFFIPHIEGFGYIVSKKE